MNLSLTEPFNTTIPMNKMTPGQFAWCEKKQAIIFATAWAGNVNHPYTNYVALNREGHTWDSNSTLPVQLLPPGTQLILEA